jgi:hypothetical protein
MLERQAAVVNIDQFHRDSAFKHPVTTCRIAHGPREIYLRYNVHDRYVRCVRQGFQSDVWKDSCVEFFVQPKPDMGYFNFETNCGGSLLLSYVGVPTRFANKVLNATSVTADQAAGVKVASSLPPRFESKGDEVIDWWVTVTIPIDFMQTYVGPLEDLGARPWRGNFFKCDNETPRPHYASWSPVGEWLAFHQPEKFGTLMFE